MTELAAVAPTPAVARSLPDWAEVVGYATAPGRQHVVDLLRAADRSGRPVVQPRCGVGDHAAMLALLRELAGAGPAVLSVTVDAHTRLGRHETAGRLLAESPADLNGYPLVAHGWRRGRELVEAVPVPLEVRHGSPDPRDLFAVAAASGMTSFEGGAIGYTLPYSKDVRLPDALRYWQEVDALCGALAGDGVVVDRELFGTLTAVLVPPSTSLAMTILEAVAATREGVRCVSIAVPQGGEPHQDVAALRAVRSLAARYLDHNVEVFPVLHEYMGVFPRTREYATALILHGGLVARLGGATKVVSKTTHEAYGIPDTAANAEGIRVASLGASDLFDFARLDEDRVAEEHAWIEREVGELVDPVLAQADLFHAIGTAFATGRLDIPFSANVHARSAVVPRRDPTGAIRYADSGRLPFSAATSRRNITLLTTAAGPARGTTTRAVIADINYFPDREARSLGDDLLERQP